jgi:hypothetical protein
MDLSKYIIDDSAIKIPQEKSAQEQEQVKNISASITDVTNLGLVTIEFNASLNNFNHSLIDSKVLTLEIIEPN